MFNKILDFLKLFLHKIAFLHLFYKISCILFDIFAFLLLYLTCFILGAWRNRKRSDRLWCKRWKIRAKPRVQTLPSLRRIWRWVELSIFFCFFCFLIICNTNYKFYVNAQGQLTSAQLERNKTKEQLEEEKKISLSIRIKPLEIEGLSIDKLRAKATELWETIVKLETEKYDLEERQKRQDYDVSFETINSYDRKNIFLFLSEQSGSIGSLTKFQPTLFSKEKCLAYYEIYV